MEIKLNTNIDSVARINGLTPKGREVTPAEQEVSFDQSNALNQALADTPNLRRDAVQRGQALLGSVPYPPEETVAKISHLLALSLDTNQ
jgi:hypothetical protein